MLALGLGSSGRSPLCRDWACLQAVLCWYDSKFSDWIGSFRLQLWF